MLKLVYNCVTSPSKLRSFSFYITQLGWFKFKPFTSSLYTTTARSYCLRRFHSLTLALMSRPHYVEALLQVRESHNSETMVVSAQMFALQAFYNLGSTPLRLNSASTRNETQNTETMVEILQFIETHLEAFGFIETHLGAFEDLQVIVELSNTYIKIQPRTSISHASTIDTFKHSFDYSSAFGAFGHLGHLREHRIHDVSTSRERSEMPENYPPEANSPPHLHRAVSSRPFSHPMYRGVVYRLYQRSASRTHSRKKPPVVVSCSPRSRRAGGVNHRMYPVPASGIEPLEKNRRRQTPRLTCITPYPTAVRCVSHSAEPPRSGGGVDLQDLSTSRERLEDPQKNRRRQTPRLT
ncbi:hypothetical protein C8R43DRAFT_1136271 [Mycena crocata]|nr:hypothetical protein C8R43DRAFT_1136271 [Mycena crocata]